MYLFTFIFIDQFFFLILESFLIFEGKIPF